MKKGLATKVELIAIAAALALVVAALLASNNLSADAALAVFFPDGVHFP